MDFFSRIFKKNAQCARCSIPVSLSTSETCTKCSKLYTEKLVCKPCSIYLKKKSFIFYVKTPICLTCSPGRRRSISANSLVPIELKDAPPTEKLFRESKFALSPRDMPLKNFEEQESQPPLPLTSLKQVSFTQFQQDLKSLVKISKCDPKELYTTISKIGKGGFSTVYKVSHKQTHEIFALKRVKQIKDEMRLRVINEIGLMQLSFHTNIIHVKSCYETAQDLWILMEFMQYSLCSLISSKFGKMSEKIMAYIIREILQGLSWLHRNNRIHRDIKSDNVLISESGEIKITDFGVSLQLTIEDNPEKVNIAGTPCWMAPEVIEGNYHDSKADVWSLGILAIELAQKDPPFIECEKYVAMQNIVNGPSPKLKNPDRWSKYFNDFVKCCVDKVPDRRSSVDELLNHTFIQRVGPAGKEIFGEFLREWESESRVVNN